MAEKNKVRQKVNTKVVISPHNECLPCLFPRVPPPGYQTTTTKDSRHEENAEQGTGQCQFCSQPSISVSYPHAAMGFDIDIFQIQVVYLTLRHLILLSLHTPSSGHKVRWTVVTTGLPSLLQEQPLPLMSTSSILQLMHTTIHTILRYSSCLLQQNPISQTTKMRQAGGKTSFTMRWRCLVELFTSFRNNFNLELVKGLHD